MSSCLPSSTAEIVLTGVSKFNNRVVRNPITPAALPSGQIFIRCPRTWQHLSAYQVWTPYISIRFGDSCWFQKWGPDPRL